MAIDRSHAAWWVLGGVLAFALLLFVYSFVGTLVFGLFIYYATRSIYSPTGKSSQPVVSVRALAEPERLGPTLRAGQHHHRPAVLLGRFVVAGGPFATLGA